jgi:Holliday junction resolvase
MTGQDAERELRSILRGDADWLRSYSSTMPPHVRENYMKIASRPFVVARAAGSFGIDLVAIRYDYSFPIEVKSSSSRVIRLSRNKRIKEQAEWLKRECAKAGILPIYAYRLKRVRNDDAWRIFTLPVEKIEGRFRLLYNLLPKLQETAQGNLKLEWENGMPLNKLLEYLCPAAQVSDAP